MFPYKRKLEEQLEVWKDKKDRLPLILWGARQVGKSTTVETFGNRHFPKVHTFNFQKKIPQLNTVFKGELNPSEILQGLALVGKQPISSEDLIFLDEIQECPEALTSLKYFAESFAHQAIIAAGSHLGLLQNAGSFPVGKVEFLSLHPMTYFEFLENMEPETAHYLSLQTVLDEKPIAELYHQRAKNWLRLYLCVGGMPEVIKTFASLRDNEHQAAQAAREVQHRLLEGYQSDFTKYAGVINSNHILRVFDAVALQLGRVQDESVKKFKFSGVIPGKKGLEGIEGPLTWLEKARLVIKTFIANRFEQPIKAFTQQNYFKTYLFDIGILQAMLETPVESLLLEKLDSYSGYVAENFVAQELFATSDAPLFGWSENESEVEFVISRATHLCPIEVKSSSRSRRAKSLDALINRYHPDLSIKATNQNRGYEPKRKILTLPLYLVGNAMEASFKEKFNNPL